jgi:hypothetical protein
VSPRCTLLLLAAAGLACAPADGALELRVLGADGAPTPARVEILDADGRAHVAADALEVRLECWTPPLPDWAAGLQRATSIDNPYTGTTQFYLDGTARATLPPGRYRVSVSKGNEYRTLAREVDVRAGETTRALLSLERWTDMPARGWYSADDHVHVTRRGPADDLLVGRWMRAEGLDVANLLRMGTAEHFDITPQYAFGDAGAHRYAETLLLAGQEHPRTHVLGHTITLAAEEAIDRRDSYSVYAGFWRESARLGGASGYAHWGEGQARDGLALDAPSGLLSFVEVLQFDLPHYDVWYELLDLGLRLAPTAGTDFPCIPSVPGRERFYARTGQAPTRASFAEAVRRGRTFVTNGPVLELDVGGADIGDELRLAAPGPVRIRGRVRFDAEREDVHVLELLRDGRPVATATRRTGPGEIALEHEEVVAAPAWFALRASGDKRGETRMRTPWYLSPRALAWGCRIGCGASLAARGEFVGEGRPRPSAAHTAAVRVELPGAAARPAPALVRRYLERLDALEARLADERLSELVVWRPFPGALLIDGVPEEALRRDRPQLREAIASARAYYRALLPDGAPR